MSSSSIRSRGAERGWETRRRNQTREKKKIAHMYAELVRLRKWLMVIRDLPDKTASEMAVKALGGKTPENQFPNTSGQKTAKDAIPHLPSESLFPPRDE